MVDIVTTGDYGIADFATIVGDGVSYADEKTLWLSKTGDKAVLSPTAGIKSITIHWLTKMRWHMWSDNLKLNAVNYEKAWSGDNVIQTGHEHEYHITEQKEFSEYVLPDGTTIGSQHQGTGYMASDLYVDDLNTELTLTDVTLTDGTHGKIRDANTPGKLAFTWTMYDAQDKVISSGTDGSVDACKGDIKVYGEAKKLSFYKWDVKDALGNIKDSGQYPEPGKSEFPWIWVAVAIAVIAVVAVILLLYMRSGHTAPAGLPAAAPVPGGVLI
jgi:hypothetical protein